MTEILAYDSLVLEEVDLDFIQQLFEGCDD